MKNDLRLRFVTHSSDEEPQLRKDTSSKVLNVQMGLCNNFRDNNS